MMTDDPHAPCSLELKGMIEEAMGDEYKED